MSFTPERLDVVLGSVREAVREAVAHAYRGYRHAPLIEHKGAVDLVTHFDRESEAILRSRLDGLFPIIGEERGDKTPDPGAEAIFYVDPIDGTTNFVHGHPFWCVSVGLVAQATGRPMLGVVLAPALGIEWYGWTASDGTHRVIRRSAPSMVAAPSDVPPAFLEEPCTTSRNASFEESLLATGFPYDRRTSPDNNFDAFVAIKRRCQAVRRCGSAALDLCLVADGTYEGYWEKKLKPWDIAAGIALVEAAGGRVTDFDGQASASSLTTGHVVASNGAIHETLLAELRSVSGPRSVRIVRLT